MITKENIFFFLINFLSFRSGWVKGFASLYLDQKILSCSQPTAFVCICKVLEIGPDFLHIHKLFNKWMEYAGRLKHKDIFLIISEAKPLLLIGTLGIYFWVFVCMIWTENKDLLKNIFIITLCGLEHFKFSVLVIFRFLFFRLLSFSLRLLKNLPRPIFKKVQKGVKGRSSKNLLFNL